MRKILLYGDVDLNIIDGSAVWLVSMAEALSRTGSEVCVLLKTGPDGIGERHMFSSPSESRHAWVPH